MNGLHGAVESGCLAHFLQGQIRLLAEQSSHVALVSIEDHRLASGKAVARPDIPSASALLQELLDHAE